MDRGVEKDAPWRADDHPPHSWPIGSVAGWRDGHGCPTTWCKGEGSRRDETFNTRVTSPDVSDSPPAPLTTNGTREDT